MIDEDDLKGLAALGPQQAFRKIERLARAKLEDARRRTSTFDSNPEYDDFDYMSTVLAAAQECGIPELAGYELPWRSDDGWLDRCRQFRGEAERISTQLLVRHSLRADQDPNSVALHPATKERLRFHIGQIRQTVDMLQVDEIKRDRLYKALSRLELEIGKNRTPVAAVNEVIALSVKGLEPVLELAQRVVEIIYQTKSRENESAKLPAPPETKRIEPPRGKNSTPKKGNPDAFDKALDDEIPF